MDEVGTMHRLHTAGCEHVYGGCMLVLVHCLGRLLTLWVKQARQQGPARTKPEQGDSLTKNLFTAPGGL